MAVAMFMQWEGVTAEKYDAVRAIVQWETDPAPGGLFHVASVDERGIHVTDIWESAEQFQTFVTNRLMPGVAQGGIDTRPVAEIVPIHALFTPAVTRV